MTATVVWVAHGRAPVAPLLSNGIGPETSVTVVWVAHGRAPVAPYWSNGIGPETFVDDFALIVTDDFGASLFQDIGQGLVGWGASARFPLGI